jgi:hypothetical protein
VVLVQVPDPGVPALAPMRRAALQVRPEDAEVAPAGEHLAAVTAAVSHGQAGSYVAAKMSGLQG